MKKTLTFIVFITSIFLILLNSYEIMEGIKFSFYICINNLFPSLIPFMLLSNILIKYNFVSEVNDLFGNLMKLFKVNKNASFVFIMSILSGSPSNAKYIKDLLDNKLININDAKKCLKFCHFTNPVFVIGTIGYTFLNNKKLGLIILISHYLSSFIIGIIFRNKKCSNINNNISKYSNNKKFITILNESIISTANTLLLILGVITFCLIITGLVDNIFNINNNLKFIYGFLEITQGLKYLSISNLNIYIKTIIASFIISFGGLCIHIQVFSILDNKKIRYFPYLYSRIIHAIISSLITILIIKIFF